MSRPLPWQQNIMGIAERQDRLGSPDTTSHRLGRRQVGGGTRTQGLNVKSLVLYHLSYGLAGVP